MIIIVFDLALSDTLSNENALKIIPFSEHLSLKFPSATPFLSLSTVSVIEPELFRSYSFAHPSL
jgi:hypothetical protein